MSLLYLKYCKRPYLRVYFKIYSQYKITLCLVGKWKMMHVFIFVTKLECILTISLKKKNLKEVKKNPPRAQAF